MFHMCRNFSNVLSVFTWISLQGHRLSIPTNPYCPCGDVDDLILIAYFRQMYTAEQPHLAARGMVGMQYRLWYAATQGTGSCSTKKYTNYWIFITVLPTALFWQVSWNCNMQYSHTLWFCMQGWQYHALTQISAGCEKYYHLSLRAATN